MAKKRGGAYYVEWLDHTGFSENRWRSLETAKELVPDVCHSVGFVVHKTREAVTLAAHVSEFDNFQGEMCIMRRSIKRMVPVKIPRPRK